MILRKLTQVKELIFNLLSDDHENYDCTNIYNLLIIKPVYLGIENANYNLYAYFEYIFGNIIRTEQIDFSNRLLYELKGDVRQNFHQLLMGEGKSSVIAPLTTLLLLKEGNPDFDILHVMPESLVLQSKRILTNIIGQIDSSLLNKKIKVYSDYEIKAELLQGYENKELIDKFKNSYIMYDEIDEISDPLKSQLNIQSKSDGYETIDNSKETIDFIAKFIYNLYFGSTNLSSDLNDLKCDFGIVSNDLVNNFNFKFKPHLILNSNVIMPEALKLINNLYLCCIRENLGPNYKIAYEYLISNQMEKLENLVESTKDREESINLSILNMLYNFEKVIPMILKQLHRRHYGLKHSNSKDISVLYSKYGNLHSDDILKKYFIAVPFIADEKPSDKSEFTDYLYNIALTIISYFDNPIKRIRYIDLQLYLEHIYELYKIDKFNSPEKNKGLNLYLELTKNITNPPNIIEFKKITNFDKNQIDQMKNNFPIVHYVIDIILPRFIKIVKFVNSLSFTDIVSSNFCGFRTGFTGTPNVYLAKETNPDDEIESIIRQKGGDGAVVASIIGLDKPNKIIVEDDFLNIINIGLDNKYHTIIDTGSFFINNDSNQIAQNIINQIKNKNLEDKFKCVVFIDKSNKKMALTLDNDLINYESLNIPLINRFYYYDQGHITGIDMKIYSEAKGLITISPFNRFRDIAQGIYRLRNINKGQTVDFVLNSNLNNILNGEIKELVKYLIENEEGYKKNQLPLFNKQNIQTIYRNYFTNQGIYSIQTTDDKFKYLETSIYRQPLYISIHNINEIKMTLLMFSHDEFEFILNLGFIDQVSSDLIKNIIKKTSFDLVEIQSNQFESTQEQEQQQQQQSNTVILNVPISNINKKYQLYSLLSKIGYLNKYNYRIYYDLKKISFKNSLFGENLVNIYDPKLYIVNNYHYQTELDKVIEEAATAKFGQKPEYFVENPYFTPVFYGIYDSSSNEFYYGYSIGWVEFFDLDVKTKKHKLTHIIIIKRFELETLYNYDKDDITFRIKLIGNGEFYSNINDSDIQYDDSYPIQLLFLKIYLRDKSLTPIEITKVFEEFYKLRKWCEDNKSNMRWNSFNIDRVYFIPRQYNDYEVKLIQNDIPYSNSNQLVFQKPYFNDYIFRNLISKFKINTLIISIGILKYIIENIDKLDRFIISKNTTDYDFNTLIYILREKINLCTGTNMKGFAKFYENIISNPDEVKEVNKLLNQILIDNQLFNDNDISVKQFISMKFYILQAWNIIVEARLLQELPPNTENICE